MGRPRGSLQSAVTAAAQAGGTLVVVVGALGTAVAVVAADLAFRALAATARALAAVAMGEAVNPLAVATRAGRVVNTLATAAGTGRAVNTLATVVATVSRVSTPVTKAVVAMPTAIAPLTSLGTSSMRVIRITLPIVATAVPVRGRNISARSKAVGMVVPVSQRAAFPPAAQAVSDIARAADGRAVGGKFCCGGPAVGATHASHHVPAFPV
jgi:hypothetical protein